MDTMLQPLLNTGALGIVLAWHLWRTDRRLERLERALERWTRAQLLALLARPEAEPGLREHARQLLQELSQPGNGGPA